MSQTKRTEPADYSKPAPHAESTGALCRICRTNPANPTGYDGFCVPCEQAVKAQTSDLAWQLFGQVS